MEKILEYLKEKYRPSSLIVYGAFADGKAHPGDAFEAIALGPTSPHAHDTEVVDGVKLDVTVYPRDIFYGEISLEEFECVTEGYVALDSDGMGTWLKNLVTQQIASIPRKPLEAVADAVDWCLRSLERAKVGDAEGLFRGHWLLVDSLEIYCDAVGLPFLSPAKAMEKMAKLDAEAFAAYSAALAGMDIAALGAWVEVIKARFEKME